MRKHKQFSFTSYLIMKTSQQQMKVELATVKEEAAKKRWKMVADCKQWMATIYQPASISRGEEQKAAGCETTTQWRKPMD